MESSQSRLLGLLPLRLVLLALVFSYFLAMGGPAGPAFSQQWLVVTATVYLALTIVLGWLGTAENRTRACWAQCWLDNFICLAVIPFDPGSAAPLLLLTMVNPLEFGLRYGLASYQFSLLAAAATALIALTVRPEMTGLTLSPETLGVLLLTWVGIGYGLLSVLSVNGLRQRLQDLLGRHSTAMSAVGFATWTWSLSDPSGERKNPAVDQLMGLAPGSYNGNPKSLSRFAIPRDREKITQCIDDALRNNSGFETRFQCERPDGNRQWIALRGEPVEHDSAGKPTRLAGVIWDISQEKNAEDTATTALARLDQAARTTGVGFWEFDRSKQQFRVDEFGHQITGLEPGSYVPLDDALAGISPDDRTEFCEKLDDTLSNAVPIDFELRWIRQDNGNVVFIRGRGSPRLDESGAVSGVHGVLSDETESDKARREFEAFRFRHDRNLRAARVNTWSLDILTQRLEVDEHAQTIFGRAPQLDQADNLSAWLELVHPEDRQSLIRAFNRSRQYGENFEQRYRVPQTNDADRWLLTRGEVVETAADGSVIRIGGITTDVTTETQASMREQSALAKVDSVIETGSFGFWALDWDSKTLDVDRGWRALTGFSRADRAPKLDDALELIHPGDREKFLDAIVETLNSGSGFSLDLQARRADSDEIYDYHCIGHAVPGANGQITGAAGFVTDRSELAKAQRRAERAMEQVDLAAQAGCIGFWRVDTRDFSMDFDENAIRVIGRQPDRDIRHLDDAMALVETEDVDALRQALTQSASDGSILLHDFRLRRRDSDEIRYIHLRGDAIYDRDGQITHIAGFIHDQTDTARIREEADRARQLLKTAMSATRILAFAYDRADDTVRFEGDPSWIEPVHDIGAKAPVESIFELVHPDDRAALRAEIRQALANGSELSNVHRVIGGVPGEHRWHRIQGRPVLDTAGRVTGLTGVVIDETESVNNRKELDAVRGRYEAALRAANMGAWNLFSDDGRIETDQFLNSLISESGKQFDYELTSFLDIIDERDRDQVAATIETAQQKNHPFECQYRLPRKEGTERWVRSRGEPVAWNDDGSVQRMAGATWDVTGEVEAQAARDLFRDRHDHTLRFTEIACWNWTAADNKLVYDDWAPALIGSTPEAVGDRMEGFYACVHEADRQRVIDDFTRILGGSDDAYNMEFRAKNSFERVRWVRTTGQISRRADGRPDKVFGIIQDVDAEVHLRQQLERSNVELEDFAHVASHDLREPLRGLKSYSQLLMRRYSAVLDDEGISFLHALQQLSTRLDNVVSDLLKYSRFGITEMAVTETDVQQLLDEVIQTLQYSLKEKNIQIRTSGELPVIRCDRVRVGELLRNLVTNAIKYNESETRWIEVGYENGVFHVRDNGIGIAAEHLETVFAIFRRLHDRDAFGGGTGAGLSFCKRIVNQHNGHIWVESEPGDGSCFYFTLDADTPITRYDGGGKEPDTADFDEENRS